MTTTVDTEPRTEARFLGNADSRPVGQLDRGRAGRSFRAPKQFTEPAPEKPQLVEMLLEAEKHATNALLRLQDAELDAGIAYLQSALAFAQNYRHAIRTPETAQ